MFGLQRLFILTLFSLPVLTSQVVGAEMLPTPEVQKNIIVLTSTRSCRNCDLSSANLNRLDLSGVNLEGANLSRSTLALTNLSGANFQNADLREAVFSGADLAKTDMRGADLTGASFVGAYMVGALMDGEMLSTTPYAKDDISDVEESIYVEDTVKSKKPQMTDEMTIGSRRDFEETPPAVPEENIKKKIAQGPPKTVFVQDIPAVADELPEEKFPIKSNATPDAKVAPSMHNVRLNQDVSVPDVLPEIKETKKEQSTKVVPEKVLLGKKEVAIDDVKVDEASEQDSVVEESVKDPVPTEGESNIELTVEEEIATESIPVDEEPELVVEIQETPDDTEAAATAGSEELDKEITKPAIESETETAMAITETAGEVTEESAGVLQSVLSMFSSIEPSTEVLKNTAMLLDTKQCYGCNLQGVNLSGENLASADLEGADLSNANLKDVDFEEANLKGANLSGADLTGADLSEADLYKADFTGANLSDANLEKALLDDVNFTDVTGYNSSSVLLPDTN